MNAFNPAPPFNESDDEEPVQEPRVPLQQPLPPPNPPHNHILWHDHSSLASLVGELNSFAEAAGFAVYKIRSYNYVNGLPTRVDFGCKRGKIRPSEAYLRRTSTTKMDCGPWRMRIVIYVIKSSRGLPTCVGGHEDRLPSTLTHRRRD
jgi:hypothetical protein